MTKTTNARMERVGGSAIPRIMANASQTGVKGAQVQKYVFR